MRHDIVHIIDYENILERQLLPFGIILGLQNGQATTGLGFWMGKEYLGVKEQAHVHSW